jgi:hypothetical protein
LSGRGITFAIRGEGKSFGDIGNVVALEKGGKTIGYEFGFGVETILSRIYGLTRPIEASSVSEVIPFREGGQEKIADLLSATTVMYQNGVEPGNGKERFILKSHLKAVSYWQRKLNIDLKTIERWVGEYSQIEFGGDNGCSKKICNYLEDYNAQIGRYKDYIGNQIHAKKIKGEAITQKTEKLWLAKAECFRLTNIDGIEVIKSLHE